MSQSLAHQDTASLSTETRADALIDETQASSAKPDSRGLLITVEEVALLWFGEIGKNGSASSNCQKIRRLIPHTLPARRIGNRWYVNRATAEAWTAGSDPASAMAHPDTRRWSK